MRSKWTALVALGLVAGLADLAGGCSLGSQSDGDSPSLIITSPTTDTVSGTVVFSAEAADASGIEKIRFSVDTTLLAEDLAAPYETVWHSGPASKGAHTLKAEALDFTGNTTTITKVVIVTDPKQ